MTRRRSVHEQLLDSLPKARLALASIPANIPHNEWIRVGMAAHAAGLTFEDFNDWSAQGDTYDLKAAQAAWRSFKPGGGIGAGSLFHIAQANGYDPGNQRQRTPPLRSVRLADRRAEQASNRPSQNSKMGPTPADIWNRCQPATADHGYIFAKQGQPDGLRVVPAGDPLSICGESMAGALVVPVRDIQSSEPTSLQFIAAPDAATKLKAQGKSSKLNLPGCSVSGVFWVGVQKLGSPVFLVEGIGQAWAVFSATGFPAVVCFGWGRVRGVATQLQEHFPDAKLVLFPDAGKEDEARRTGQELGIDIVTLPDGCHKNFDANDYAQAEGIAALSALTHQRRESFQPNTQAHHPKRPSWCDARDGTESTQALTEQGNAIRLFRAHGHRLRYLPELGHWLVWEAGAWQRDTDGAGVRTLAGGLPETIYQDGNTCLDQAEYFAKWSRQSQTHKIILSAVKLLSDQPDIRIPTTHLDANPWLCGLNQCRHVLNLKTQEIRPAQQGDYVTKSLNVQRVGSSSEARAWCRFLGEVFQQDEELIDWLHRWCGYLLTGSTEEHVLLFFYGDGANGKSVFADVLQHILGDYGRTVRAETLTDKKRTAGSATPDLVPLVGARLALSTETEDGVPLAEGAVKTMVSGDRLSARPNFGSQFEFTPTFKLLMLGNHQPQVRGTDNGIWRRIRLVPFRRVFAPEEQDRGLSAKLRAEAPHILAWMREGCQAWQQRGLKDIPAIVHHATRQYRDEQDSASEWIQERCRTGAGLEADGAILYQDYRLWAMQAGLHPLSRTAFGRRLTALGFDQRPSNGKRLRQGISLTVSSYPVVSRHP